VTTDEEIIKLKNNWMNDPCWDIEETEGFEDHRDELYRFRLKKENEWENKRNEELHRKAAKYGCDENLKLAGYIQFLENRINKLESDLHLVMYPCD